MSDENNNNETPKSKTNISPNDQDNITTNTNLNSPKRSTRKELVFNLLSVDRRSSSTLIDDIKNSTHLLENETLKTETTNKDLRKIGTKNKSIRKKRKKGKKGKKSKRPETEATLLTEVKTVIKKKEETENHKYLREKLEKFNFAKNLQMGINFGFEKANDEVKDDLVDNYNINENKKNTIEELVPKPKKKLKLNINLIKKGIKFKIDKESIMRLNNLKKDEKIIKIKLNKIEENQKLLDSELPIQNDIITMNNRKNQLKKIASMKNDLLLKLKINSNKISEIIDSNRTINKNILKKNYISPEINKNYRNNNLIHFCLSEDQERFNKHLLQIQKEEKNAKEEN